MREVIHSKPYWIQMVPAFSGVANEEVQATTENFGQDLLVRGAWSSVNTPRVRFKIGGMSQFELSAARIPIDVQAGVSSDVHPLRYWRVPIYLGAQKTIRGDFRNDGAEASGRVAFLCDRVGTDGKLTIDQSADYYLLADLGGVTKAFTAQEEDDLLIWGASTDVTSLTNLAKITDESTGEPWSTDSLPLRAMCGLHGNPQPIMYYRKPYYLPANRRLRVDLGSAGSTGNYVAFRCERFAKKGR